MRDRRSASSIYSAVLAILWIVSNHLIVLKLHLLLLKLRCHVTDGKTPFLPSAVFHWFAIRRAN